MLVHAPDETLLHVREFGSGTPIVLLHGGTGTGNYDWELTIHELAEHFRVVTLDMRGHGESVTGRWNLGIYRFGLDVEQVMRRLGIPRALLIGFSVGANTLIALASRRPNLSAGLVTIGASARGDASKLDQIDDGPWLPDLIAIEHRSDPDPDYWRKLRRKLGRDWADHVDFTPDLLARIKCPVLIIHGDRDRIVSLEESLALEAGLPDATLLHVPGAGHMVQRDQPEAFIAAVLEFARRVQAAEIRLPRPLLTKFGSPRTSTRTRTSTGTENPDSLYAVRS